MQFPKITVITPSYNQGQFIEETILSVINQGYPNLEYIIIDGGSIDNSVDIIKKYDPYITYWVSEKDEGQSDAINKGLKVATGEVVNWLNSDDYYEANALHKVGKAFQDDPSLNVYCGISRVFGNGNEVYSNGTDIHDCLEKTIGLARIDQPETFYRRNIWETLKNIDNRFHYLMDKELWIRYLFKFGLVGIKKTNELLVHFRLHELSKTVSQLRNFEKEGYDLFYSIAVANKLVKEADFLKKEFQAELIELNYENIIGNVRKVIHYFFWGQINEAYALNDWYKFNLMKKQIDINELSKNDKHKYNRIVLRAQLLPTWAKKLWNNI